MTIRHDPLAPSLERFAGLPTDSQMAILFPGQGSQTAGMGAEIYRGSKAAREVFDYADAVLGEKLSVLCFEGPDAELTSTVNAQPAILTTSVAYFVAAIENQALDGRPVLLSGHSLGEYTALVVAGAIAFGDAVRLVRERGRLMEEAGRQTPGTMAAIVGLGFDEVRAICATSGAEPCNFNAATQIVVGGSPEAVERACVFAKDRGGRGLAMNVAGAFHTSLMEHAAQEFSGVLDGISVEDPAISVLGNVTAREMTSSEECITDLARQIRSPVMWHQSIVAMQKAGVSTFVEIGPGRTLITMLKRDAPQATLVSLDGASVVPAGTNV